MIEEVLEVALPGSRQEERQDAETRERVLQQRFLIKGTLDPFLEPQGREQSLLSFFGIFL